MNITDPHHDFWTIVRSATAFGALAAALLGASSALADDAVDSTSPDGLETSTATAPSEGGPRVDPVENLDGAWSFTVGFGEIPFLAGSFKPSVSFGYHINRFIYVGTIVQLPDFLERGDESFNATNAEVDGLLATRERTGPRVFLGARFRPHRYSPYLAIGGIFNGTDTETMDFDARARTLGDGTVDGRLTVELSRPFGIRPAFGLGYGFTFDNGLVLNLEFTGAWLFPPPDPDIRIESESPLSPAARQELHDRFRKAYDDNFHNRYHLFNISVGYAW